MTGASRGIGRAIVAGAARVGPAAIAAALRAGARVAGCARHAAQGCRPATCASAGDVARFAAARAATPGRRPTSLVNNAGIVAARRASTTCREADWDDVMDSNLKGTFLVTRAFLAAMRARGSGRIINIASISGRQGTAQLTAYCAAKHGVVGLTRALAEELRDDGIAVNAICPGSVDTEMLRVGMPGRDADDVAGGRRAAWSLYLAADAPPALTGSCVDVFGLSAMASPHRTLDDRRELRGGAAAPADVPAARRGAVPARAAAAAHLRGALPQP